MTVDTEVAPTFPATGIVVVFLEVAEVERGAFLDADVVVVAVVVVGRWRDELLLLVLLFVF
jgi:hypothetical protein